MGSTVTKSSKPKRERKFPWGCSYWPENRGKTAGWIARIGKHIAGKVLRKWHRTEEDAVKWIELQLDLIRKLGQSDWKPSRFQLLDYERVEKMMAEMPSSGSTMALELLLRRAWTSKPTSPFNRARRNLKLGGVISSVREPV